MSTHAHIGVENDNGTVTYIYVHFDGYLSHTGRALLEDYSTEEVACALIESGDQSELGEPYRDRPGERWENIKPRSTSVEDFLSPTAGLLGTYTYLFTNGSWVCRTPGRQITVGVRRALEKGIR